MLVVKSFIVKCTYMYTVCVQRAINSNLTTETRGKRTKLHANQWQSANSTRLWLRRFSENVCGGRNFAKRTSLQ